MTLDEATEAYDLAMEQVEATREGDSNDAEIAALNEALTAAGDLIVVLRQFADVVIQAIR